MTSIRESPYVKIPLAPQPDHLASGSTGCRSSSIFHAERCDRGCRDNHWSIDIRPTENHTVKGVPPTPQLSPALNVVKEQKGPVMTTLDEFYKVGPGPSSSHT